MPGILVVLDRDKTIRLRYSKGTIPTTLTCLTPPPTTASVGEEFYFHVELSDASGPLQGREVTWYINDTPQITSTTNSQGRCLFGGTFAAPGTMYNQAKFDGDGNHAPSETVRYETVVS